jgi:hypothetical protein
MRRGRRADVEPEVSMSHRRTVALLVTLVCCSCGGSDGGGGGGGGGGAVNLVNFQVASVIVGQTLATGGTANNGAGVGNRNQIGLDAPFGHVGNGSLYVADSGNQRIMGWNSIPTANGTPADFVLGVADFTSAGGGVSATLLDGPRTCWVASGALFVSDSGNDRVLIYAPPPTATNTAANIAIGQPNLTTNASGSGQAGLNLPVDACVALGRVVVADLVNNRVLIWNGVPVANGTNAQLVVGQPNFTTTTPGVTQSKLTNPAGVWTDGVRLVVADSGNHRVLIWNTFPTTNGQAADLVVGQADFTSNSSGTGAQKFDQPWSVASDGVQLFVAELANNRVLIFPFPTSNNASATGVLGQANFANVAPNDDDQNGSADPGPTGRTLDGPTGVAVFGNQLLVSDNDNDRILVFTGS